MSRYRKIEVRTWADERFSALSPMPPSAQGLWFFLLTGPHTGPIPGMFRAGRAAMAEELGWDQEAFDKAFREVLGQGMAKADFKSRFVWLPNAVKYNKPESPNVIRGWKAELDLLPECDLKREAMAALRAEVESMGAAHLKAFDEITSTEDKASGKAYWKASPKTMANQEQEQEQEESQNTLVIAVGADPSTSDPESFKPDGKPHLPCPHEAIVAAYHELLPTCRRVAIWNPARRGHLQARWREEVASEHWTEQSQGIEGFRDFFGYVAKSPFLTGRVAGANGKPPFVASLDWLLKPTNWANVLEGKYHRS